MELEPTREQLGNLIDRLDNIIALQKAPALPDTMRIDSLLSVAKDTRQDLHKLYIELGGEDHWENLP